MTIAPALTIGLNGRFVASTEIALKASPDGSTPTRSSTFSRPCCSSASPNTNGFEIDCSVNSWRLSPTSYRWPSVVTTAMPNAFGSARPSSGM